MSEITLSSVERRFIVHWGEMGSRWGVNRTMAQIHALLYMASRPLQAEEIAEALQVARSNVSTSLRQLQGWKIVWTVHVFGDRRDHFETDKDVWRLFRTILEERKLREIDPTISSLRECLEEVKAAGPAGEGNETKVRLLAMLQFFEVTNSWYEALRKLPDDALIRLLKLGDRLPRMLQRDSEQPHGEA